jgi:serine/threonine protein kinase
MYPNHFSVCPRDGAALVEALDWSEGMLIRSKYRILSKVAQGGMGAVYKARHVMFEELLALKVMNADLVRDDVFVKRFKQEAVIARKLDHPNAVRVHDIDEAEDGRPFIVMEYIQGVSLKRVMQQEGRLLPARACSIAAQIAGALDAAHRIGMVHRDVKPANVVLVASTGGERAKVLDFGIAKVKETRLATVPGLTLTETGMVVGTPQYMSPEQASGKRGDEVDGRSDIYSLGVLIYQMLTGELPFRSDTTMGLLMAHINSPPRPILGTWPDLQIPARLAQLVMKCLEKKPDMRPQSGAALMQQLQLIEQQTWPAGPTVSLGKGSQATARESWASHVPAEPISLQPARFHPPVAAGTTRSSPVEAVMADELTESIGRSEPVSKSERSPRMGTWIAAALVAIATMGAGFAVWRLNIHGRIRAPQAFLPLSQAPVGKAYQASSVNTAGSRTANINTPEPEGSAIARRSGGIATGLGPAETLERNSARRQNKPGAVQEPGGATARVGTGTKAFAHGRPELQASMAPRGSPEHRNSTLALSYEPAPATPPSPDVVVLTAPGAAVFMDDKRMGTADSQGRLKITGAQPGPHVLRLALAGFPDLEDHLTVPPSEGGTSTVFVSTQRWGGLPAGQTAVTAGTLPPPRKAAPPATDPVPPSAKPFKESFGVVHVRRFGLVSCKGVLVIDNDHIEFRADKGGGKDSFNTPLDGVIWGKGGHGDFYLRLADGRDYTFRTESASAISAAIYKALGQSVMLK